MVGIGRSLAWLRMLVGEVEGLRLELRLELRIGELDGLDWLFCQLRKIRDCIFVVLHVLWQRTNTAICIGSFSRSCVPLCHTCHHAIHTPMSHMSLSSWSL